MGQTTDQTESGLSVVVAGRQPVVLQPATRNDGPLSVTRRLARRLLVRPGR